MTVTAIAEPDNTWALFTAASEGKKLPPYYLLCRKVQQELRSAIRIVRRLEPMATPLSYLLAFSGVGHVFTAAGRRYWTIVLWKYFLFVCVCVGIWTDEIYQAYRIEAEVRQFTIRDQDDATIEFLMLAIASRVILLQALGPTTTLISTVVVSTCDAPLLVFSSQLRALIPPLLHREGEGRAAKARPLRGEYPSGRMGSRHPLAEHPADGISAGGLPVQPGVSDSDPPHPHGDRTVHRDSDARCC